MYLRFRAGGLDWSRGHTKEKRFGEAVFVYPCKTSLSIQHRSQAFYLVIEICHAVDREIHGSRQDPPSVLLVLVQLVHNLHHSAHASRPLLEESSVLLTRFQPQECTRYNHEPGRKQKFLDPSETDELQKNSGSTRTEERLNQKLRKQLR